MVAALLAAEFFGFISFFGDLGFLKPTFLFFDTTISLFVHCDLSSPQYPSSSGSTGPWGACLCG